MLVNSWAKERAGICSQYQNKVKELQKLIIAEPLEAGEEAQGNCVCVAFQRSCSSLQATAVVGTICDCHA